MADAWKVVIDSDICPHKIPLYNDVLGERVVYCGYLYPVVGICQFKGCPRTPEDTAKTKNYMRYNTIHP